MIEKVVKKGMLMLLALLLLFKVKRNMLEVSLLVRVLLLVRGTTYITIKEERYFILDYLLT